MKITNKGYVELSDIMLSIFISSISLAILSSIFVYFQLQYPQSIAKRNYLLQHPEMLVVTEIQRGGELPSIPNINVKLTTSPEAK